MKDIPLVNRFQGVVSFFFVGVFQGTLTSDRERKLKEIPSFFFFSFCIPLVISPTSSSLVSTSRVLPGKKKKSQSALISFSPLCYSNASFGL